MSRDILMCALKTLQRVHKECRLESDGDLGCLVRESICNLLEAIQDAQKGITMYPDGRMRAEDAALYLGINSKALAQHRTRGTGPLFVKVGRIFYFKSDLDNWLNDHRKKQTEGGKDEKR